MRNNIFLILLIIFGPITTVLADFDSALADPNDMYCEHWDTASKKLFLDKQIGKIFETDDPDSSRFVFYQSPAQHGAGAPSGECGIRILIYKKGPDGKLFQSGKWEKFDLGMTMFVFEGSHHCYFQVDGGGSDLNAADLEENFIIDDDGNTTAANIPGSIEQGVWLTQEGKDLFWVANYEQLMLLTPEGNIIWKDDEKSFISETCFSLDKKYAFRLYEERYVAKHASIFTRDGKNKWSFQLPFSDVEGHKEIMGFDEAGNLMLKVDRNIYRVDHDGKAVLMATLPIYHRRHNKLETTPPRKRFDVDYVSSVNHSFEFATNVEMKGDHPRPELEFNINTFEARESLDEGKTWHSISIKPDVP